MAHINWVTEPEHRAILTLLAPPSPIYTHNFETIRDSEMCKHQGNDRRACTRMPHPDPVHVWHDPETGWARYTWGER